jgi:osmotically-inducible protein OsmY
MKINTNVKKPWCSASIGWMLLIMAVFLCLTSGSPWRLHAAESKPVITDLGITLAVQRNLNLDIGVVPATIDVKTSQGIVTLSGSVDNLLAKDRARKIAETIRGVKGVVNLLAVKPVARPDEDIRKDILMALLRDPATESYQIGVSVKDGTVKLTGSVGSWAESQLAADVACDVSGIKDLQNDISINYTAKHTDAEIAAVIEARLHSDIWVAGDPIEVQVNSGKVTLTGAVGSVLERWQATADAWVMGVQAVESRDLKVNSEMQQQDLRKSAFAPKSDEQIKQGVLAAFHFDPRVASSAVQVIVENGEVILYGKVTHLKAKQAAGQDARNILGVRGVDNQVEMDPFLDLPSDADTQGALRAALAWNSLMFGAHIEAAVIRHVAYLSGTVDTPLQKTIAQDLASRIKGVMVVRNKLNIEPGDWVWNERWAPHATWPSPPPMRSDQEIKKAVEQAFFWSPFVDRNDIKVTVDGGVVVLTGTVGSSVGWMQAYQDAKRSGASTVIDRLKIVKNAWF